MKMESMLLAAKPLNCEINTVNELIDDALPV